MAVKIIGTGSAYPQNIVTNDDMAKIVDTSDEWIQSRTGIKERRIATKENVSSLSYDAAKIALDSSGKKAEDINLIIVASMSSDQIMPNVASSVQASLGAVNAFCFDLNAACSGFVYALSVANAYIEANMAQNVLVIGAETISGLLDWTDRGTCVLFGDGAGAVVLTKTEKGISAFSHGSDGVRGDALTCYLNQAESSKNKIRMNGQEVFKFAVKTVPDSILEALKKADCKVEEVDLFLLHQANIRIIQSVSKRLKVDMERFPCNLDRYGNTSAASIPILLDEINKEGRLKPGDKIVLSGFGGGLTFGSALIEW